MSRHAAREREWKLEVPADAAGAPAAALASAGFATTASPTRRLVATYWDTETRRLARWGATLRHRPPEGWTLKLPRVGSGSGLHRDEVLCDAPPDAPPGELLDAAALVARGAALAPVAEVVSDRATLRLAAADGRPLAELVDDTVEGRCADGSTVAFRELELEALPDAADDELDDVLAVLAVAGAVPAPPVPKLVRILGAGAPLEHELPTVTLTADATAHEVIVAAVRRSVDQLVRHLPVALLDLDPEGVHQSRVALRRLRSDLRTFGPLVDADAIHGVVVEVRELGGILGPVRDADVLAETLAGMVEEQAEIDRDGWAALRLLMERDRADFRRELVDALTGERVRCLLDDLLRFAVEVPVAPQADDDARERLAPLVHAQWRRLAKLADRRSEGPVEELHQIRIRAKRCRYAVEAVAPVFGADARRFAKQLAAVQDDLGALQDARVAGAVLRDAAARAPTAAFCAGQLDGLLLERADEGRRRFPATWSDLRRRRHRRWLDGSGARG